VIALGPSEPEWACQERLVTEPKRIEQTAAHVDVSQLLLAPKAA
jgi:hypothetical protein